MKNKYYTFTVSLASIKSFFIWSDNDFEKVCKLSGYTKEEKEKFKRLYLVDICRGGYFLGSLFGGTFMAFSE